MFFIHIHMIDDSFHTIQSQASTGKAGARAEGISTAPLGADFAVSATIMETPTTCGRLECFAGIYRVYMNMYNIVIYIYTYVYIYIAQFLRCSEMQVWSKQTFTVHFLGPRGTKGVVIYIYNVDGIHRIQNR